MTTVNSLNSPSTTTQASKPASGFAALGSADFMKLMTTQLTQQDPFEPVDQKEMLAQMAQFSALAGTTEQAETLKAIAAKLDTLVTAQGRTNEALSDLAARVAASE